VRKITSKNEAARILRTDDVFEADEHAIGEESDGTPLNLHRRLASAVSRRLKFVSPDSDPRLLRFVADTDDLDGQTIRAIRELTAESAELLDRIIEITDRLPRSDQLITVTAELLRNGKARDGKGDIGPPEKIPKGATYSGGGVPQIVVNRYEPQYWVVGAMWGGRDDQFEVFIRDGYWLLGWDDEDQPIQTRRRDQIQPGDRIAIKKRSISNKSNIEIRAIGFVTGIDPQNHRVYIRWAVSDLHQEVPSRGCFASIHGPFSGDEDWTQRAFQLEQLEHRLSGSNSPSVDAEFIEFLDQLLVRGIRDDRADPEPRRQARFQTGWEDFTKKRKKYDDLDYLTWQNLGNRCGVRYGDQPREYIRTIYEIAAELYGKAQQQRPIAEIRLPEEIPDGATYSEGCVQRILINRYERDPHAREACIARFGTVCYVCCLDLVSRYGQVVAGFIHVHHLKTLASVGVSYQVDPERDLRPVCPNCHAVIHRREPPYSIEEVQEFIRNVDTD
jgi:hypothetical protein